MATKKTPRVKKLTPEARKKAAFAGAYAWKEFAHAMIEALIDSATDLKNELARPDSPLAGAVPVWALKEFISCAGDAVSGLCNLTIISELPVEIPDPLCGLYPREARDDFGRGRRTA
jgi:hypothetical protein